MVEIMKFRRIQSLIRNRKTVSWTLAVILLVIVAPLLSSREFNQQTVVLPDGGQLTLKGISYGKLHFKPSPGWKEFVYRVLPSQQLRNSFLMKFNPMVWSTPTNSFGIWLEQRGSKAATLPPVVEPKAH